MWWIALARSRWNFTDGRDDDDGTPPRQEARPALAAAETPERMNAAIDDSASYRGGNEMGAATGAGMPYLEGDGGLGTTR